MLTIVSLLLEIIILAIFKTDEHSEIISLVFIGVLTSVYCCDVLTRKKFKNVSIILVLGYLLRVILLLFDIYGRDIYILPNSGSDSEVYYHQAVSYFYSNEKEGFEFSMFMGGIMKIVGTSRLYNQYLLLLCGVATTHILLEICLKIGLEDRYLKAAIILVEFLPNYAIVSSLFLRESLPTMLVAFSVLFFVNWYKNGKSVNFLFAICFDLFASYFHSGCIAIFAGYILVLLLYNKEEKRFNLSFRGIMAASCFLLLFVFLFNNYGDMFFYKIQGVKSIDDIAQTRTRGGSNYAQYVGNSDTVINFIIYTPLRIAYFAFSPFIWQWRGLSDIIAFLFNALLSIMTFILSIKAMRMNGKYKNLIIAVFIIWLCSLLVFGWGTVTTGTAVRHRDKLIVLELILYICSLATVKNEGQEENDT